MSDGQSVRLEGIGNGPTTNEFVMLPITLHGLNDQKVQLHGEVHVVDTLRCGILIGNNILKPSKMEIRWACAEASGKDALQIGQVYVPIFSRSTQSRRLKRTAVFAARSYLIHAGTVQNIETKHKTLPPCSQGYLLTLEPKIDLSIQTFSSAARSIISHDNQPIPYSNFGQTDVQLREGTFVGFLKQSPVDAPESSPVYLNIAGLFQEGELVDHELDHMGDLPYIVHYPQDEEKTVEEADISDHWGPEYQACL